MLEFHRVMAHQLVGTLANKATDEEDHDEETHESRADAYYETEDNNVIDKERNDGLVVVARGLGLRRYVVGALVRAHATPLNLVLALNCANDAESFDWPVTIVNADMQAHVRRLRYNEGGVIAITSRILVVDLLNGTVPVHLVTGILVCDAHRVSETSTDAFCLRLIRQQNKVAFIRAFTENPESLAHSGVIWKLEKTMKLLFLRKVFFWPRFHMQVHECLDANTFPIQVRQLRIPMSESMVLLQTALLDCLRESILELKRVHSFIDAQELTLENALHSSFESLIRVQLDPVWHRVGSHAKAVVNDLGTLRRMIGYVTVYDCVAFWSLLEGVRAENALRPQRVDPWLALDAADTVFRIAKERVYKKVVLTTQGDQVADASVVADRRNAARFGNLGLLSSIPEGLEINGEEQPKWKVLRDLIQELHLARLKAISKGEDAGPILVMVHGERSCSQLSEVLSGHLVDTLPTSESGASIQAAKKVRSNPIFDDDGDNDDFEQAIKPVAPAPSTSGAPRRRQRGGKSGLAPERAETIPSSVPKKSASGPFSTIGARRLLARQISSYFRWKSSVTSLESNLKTGTAATMSRGGHSAARGGFGSLRGGSSNNAPYVRRRARGGAAASLVGPLDRKSVDVFVNRGGNQLAEEVELDDLNAGHIESENPPLESFEGIKRYSDPAAPVDLSEFNACFSLVNIPSSVVIRPYATSLLGPAGVYMTNGDDDGKMLDDLNPSAVIMYDPDAAFIRRLEVHHTIRGEGAKLSVYFMIYDNSIEEQKYLTSLRKEKDAFEKLIREKANMAIPIDQDGRVVDPEDLFWTNLDTRVAGGQVIPAANSNQVIVDVREFWSALPSHLHSHRMKLRPCTLEVGDYVLTPTICIERKSIPDLVGSFKSGRLYTQVEAMCLHYVTPVLLIEFSQGKAFGLGTSRTADVGDDLNSKLVLLTITFPKLRIIWSSSPTATAEIFADLKKDQAEPNMDDAMAVGIESGEPIDSVFSITPSDMIRALPGITSKNYRNIMRRADSIQAISEMDLDQLMVLVGEEGGRLLHEFMDADLRGGIKEKK
ncbi:hypothetical protein HDU81_007686 [Chytriomyces hyalinus]|nr:hypothetical protein HDU81_007686 [Chytriomyces hyalinus]